MSSNNIPLKFSRGYKDKLPATIEDGMIYYCIDSNELFFDYVNNSTTPPIEHRYCLNPMVGETDYGDPVGKGLVSPEDKEIIDTAVRFVEQHLEPEQQKQARLNINAVGEKTLEGGEIFNDYENNIAFSYAHAEGQMNAATGENSHAEGHNTTAAGLSAHSEGEGLGYTTLSSAATAGSNTFTVNNLDNFEIGKHITLNDEIKKITAINRSTMTVTVDSNFTKYTPEGAFVYLSGAIGDYSHSEGYKTLATGNYSHAEGSYTEATNSGAHAEGSDTIASGNDSHAEGYRTQATNEQAHSEGIQTIASGIASHAEGSISVGPNALWQVDVSTEARGNFSHAEGLGTQALESSAHSEGTGTIASGDASHSEGIWTIANGSSSHSEGEGLSNKIIITGSVGDTSYFVAEWNDLIIPGRVISYNNTYGIIVSTNEYNSSFTTNITLNPEGNLNEATAMVHSGIAFGEASHSEGYHTVAYGEHSHAEGHDTSTTGNYSHAEGYNTLASGNYSHAEGSYTEATNSGAHAEGFGTVASGNLSHAEGYCTTSSGSYGHTEGCDTQISSDAVAGHAEGNDTKVLASYGHAEGNYTEVSYACAHAEGSSSKAKGEASHAEGSHTEAIGHYSHAEGGYTKAIKSYSHAEGQGTEAQGDASHSEGWASIASGNYSHAEGDYTEASGDSSHAEGYYSKASGEFSHAEGYYSEAKGWVSHAEGEGTIASSRNQHVQGKYNIEDTENKFAHIVGNGEYQAPSNIHTLDWQGNAWFAGNIYVRGTGQETGMPLLSMTEVTLFSNNWIDNQQEVIVKGVSANEADQYIQVIPVQLDQSNVEVITKCNIKATGQKKDSIIFKCDKLPKSNVRFYIVITNTVWMGAHSNLGVLTDFEYIENDDGTYTLTSWKGTLNGMPSDKMHIPNSSEIIF